MDRFINKIACGNCYELIKQLPDKSVDLVVTDPPYEINHLIGGGMLNEKRIQNVMNELGDYELNKGVDETIWVECLRVLKKPNIYIWCNKVMIPALFDFFVKRNNCLFDIISWRKTNAMPLCGSKYLTDTEYCLYFRKDIHLNTTYETASTHYELPINIKDKQLFEHLTIKPMKIIENFIKNSSQENDIVLDPFMGSGTTAVACKELNRRFIGFEINPKWCKIANDRLNGIDKNGQISLFLR
jgi:DNA modification methylase